MKILLVAVNAKYIHSNLAVYSLRAYARKYREHIYISEYTINNSFEDILSGIYKQQADVICFSCYIWNINMITQIIGELKKIQPEAKIWFGGPEVSYDPKDCLIKYEALDGIMIGEGEQTFLELTQYYLEHKTKLIDIHGLIYKEKAKISERNESVLNRIMTDEQEISESEAADAVNLLTITPERALLSLADIPFPYEDMEKFRNKIIYYESSRGCPYSCSYCLSSVERRVRFRDILMVKKELKAFLDWNVSQVKFVDRTFNCNRNHTMEIWNFIKDNDNGITNFHFEITADLLTEEELKLLASLRPAQVQLEIGVQTTNPRTLQAIRREVDFKKLSLNVNYIKKAHNIHQHLDLIAGLPFEDFESFCNSFNDVYRLKPDQLQLGFLKILKGSLMSRESSTHKIIYRETPPYEVLSTEWLTYGDILKIKGVCAMVEVYYNSGQFYYTMQYLEHFYESPMQLYLELSLYYEEQELYLSAHGRIKRYEILLDFFRDRVIILKNREEATLEQATSSNKQPAENIDLFVELLLLDLYLREDIKGRPYFAGPSIDFKKLHEIRAAYNIGKGPTHIEHFNYDVFTSARSGKATLRDQLLLFEYERRNLINNSAEVTIL
ncbi:MAG TPA: DUF4080 domain-containing protein [Mobilitalea sp.]|nr:DUF4080 domain-containing protein [Mobilitalea sp.]